jgi:excisionase family DNA binding protein
MTGERMSTTWSQDTIRNGAASLRSSSGLGRRALQLPAADSELASSALVSAAGGIVEHPMTPEDVAVLLQIDRETVYRMARRGELPAFKVSNRWRFLPSHLQRWMEEQEREVR